MAAERRSSSERGFSRPVPVSPGNGESREPDPDEPGRPAPPPGDGTVTGPDLTVPVAALLRCPSAARALVLTTQLRAVGVRPDDIVHRRDPGASWWVGAPTRLDLARTIAQATGATLFVELDDRAHRDRGWGPPPDGSAAVPDGWVVPLADRPTVPLREMVRVAGLHPHDGTAALEQVALVLPGRQVARFGRRALDLEFDLRYRVVALSPLFDTRPSNSDDAARRPAGTGAGSTTGATAGEDTRRSARGGAAGGAPVEATAGAPPGDDDTQRSAGGGVGGGAGGAAEHVELRISARDGRALPASFLVACRSEPFGVACRVADGERLLVELGQAAALPDPELAEVVDGGTWLLAGAGFGCWRLAPVGDWIDGAGLAVLAGADGSRPAPPPLASPEVPASDGHPARIPVRVVAAPRRGRQVDALLVHHDDLRTLARLLEGQPLADVATVAPGDGHALLAAPGGVLDRVGVGEPLYRVGPGPLYLPLGHRLEPRLPPSARTRLFGTGREDGTGVDRAVVLTPGAALAFGLDDLSPAWTLWVGEVPKVDLQVPAATQQALVGLVPASMRPPAPARRRGIFRRRPIAPAPVSDWQAEAYRAEIEGRLVEAAELLRRHGHNHRAGQLYERAAQRGDADEALW